MALGDPYVTTSELRQEFSIDDAFDDDALELAVQSASTWITEYCERDFNRAAVATARRFQHCGQIVYVDDIADNAGLLVSTDDGDGTFGTSWTVSTEVQLEPLNAADMGHPYTRLSAVSSSQLFPEANRYGRALVEVTAVWGWPAVPSTVKRACLIQAQRLYSRRNSPDGVLGGFEFGAVRVGTRLDPDVENLLQSYRKNPVMVA